ncbi:hypothetical protein [Spirillospora sp. CA-128828]|uniref:hypothetical protein n=1 Tax=Spirillospora sp. CA-128828 TaxID=3240033 RepID=UPI003D92250D
MLSLDPQRRRELAKALAAYQHLMDEVVTESQHCTRKEDPEKIRVYGDIIERAAARERERARQSAESS